MLSDVRNNNTFLKHFINCIDDILRRHNRFLFHCKRMLLLPYLNLVCPLLRIVFFYIFQHFLNRFFCICNNRHIYLYIFGNRRCINIDMYDLRLWCEGMELSGNPVIESRPDRKQQIAFINRHVAGIGSMHSKISNIQRMLRRNRPSSHNRRHNRNLGLTNKLCEFLTGMSNIYSTTYKKQWTLRFTQHFNRSLELPDMHSGTGFVSANYNILRIFGISKFCHHILWKVNKHRSRSSASRNKKCFFNNSAQIFSLFNYNAVFRYTPCNTNNIHFLKRIISN